MRFSIITPCYNAAPYIEQTMQSVFGQHALTQGRASLQYIIVDGGSSDQTVALAQRVSVPANATRHLTSEPDNGMYDALAKGFEQVDANADVVAYLNAGDLYSPHAFDVVADLLTDYPTINWLTGLHITHNDSGQIVGAVEPFRYRQAWFACGGYLGNPLPFVQQESTFWRRGLLAHLDLKRLRSLRYAGDYALWQAFARHTPLAVVLAHLGGFRVHAGQLSGELDAYRAEAQILAGRASPFQQAAMWADKLLWYAPEAVKAQLTTHRYRYDHKIGQWRG